MPVQEAQILDTCVVYEASGATTSFFCKCLNLKCVECRTRAFLRSVLAEEMFPRSVTEPEEHEWLNWEGNPSNASSVDRVEVAEPGDFRATLNPSEFEPSEKYKAVEVIVPDGKVCNSTHDAELEGLKSPDESSTELISLVTTSPAEELCLRMGKTVPVCPAAPSLRDGVVNDDENEQYLDHFAFPPLMPDSREARLSLPVVSDRPLEKGRKRARQQYPGSVRGRCVRPAYRYLNASDLRK